MSNIAAARRPRPGRPPKPKHGAKVDVYLDADTEEKLRTFLATNTSGHIPLSRSQLVRRAIARYLKQEDSYWSLQFKFLEKIDEKLHQIVFYMHSHAELFSNYLFFYFLNWPEDRSPEETRAAYAKAKKMTAKFISALKDVLSQGGYLNELTPEVIQDMIIDSHKELDLREVHEQAQEDKTERKKRNISDAPAPTDKQSPKK